MLISELKGREFEVGASQWRDVHSFVEFFAFNPERFPGLYFLGTIRISGELVLGG